jgi:hypothetical protein
MGSRISYNIANRKRDVRQAGTVRNQESQTLAARPGPSLQGKGLADKDISIP